MKSHWILLAAVAAVGVAYAQTPARLSDKEVKKLIEAIDDDGDHFVDRLDDSVKSNKVRNERGEVNVKDYLKDLDDNIHKLKERFSDANSASNDAATVLRQATDIHRFIKAQPAELKGGSEWDKLASDMQRLAVAYHTTFPVPQGATILRINDKELATAADGIAKEADRFKSAVHDEKTLAQPDKDSLTNAASQLNKDAKNVHSRLADGEPATAEARDMYSTLTTIGSSVSRLTLSAPSMSALDALRGSLRKFQDVYGAPIP